MIHSECCNGSLGRRWRTGYSVLAAAAAVVVVYGSLVPFDFRAAPEDSSQAGLSAAALADASRTDFVSNVLLFLPFPFFLMGALCAGRTLPATLTAGAVVPLATAGLAWSVEWAQQFLSSRTASWTDVVASVVAAAIAVALWLVVGERLTQRADDVVSPRQPRSRVEGVLLVYAVVVVLLQLLPLDLTIRPAELAEKYRAGRIIFVPFTALDLLAARDAVGDLLRSIPFGVLALVVGTPMRTRRTTAPAFIVGLALVTAIEGGQLFVFSRVFDATDIFTGAAGVAIGVWLGRRVWASSSSASPDINSAWARIGLPVWVLVLLVRHWYPFDFTADPSFVATRVTGFFTVPFGSYYTANPFDALNEAVVKGLLAVPVGALLWRLWPSTSTVSRTVRTAVMLLGGVALFGVLEVGQVFLPGRYPDITDVLIGVGGTAVGLALAARMGRRSR